MYYFNVAGHACRCDTADELLAILGQGELSTGLNSAESERDNPSTRSKRNPRKGPKRSVKASRRKAKAKRPVKARKSKHTAGGKSTTRRSTRVVKAKAKTRGSYRKAKTTSRKALMRLPYVEEGITWDVTKRIAEQVGRTDLRQLRHDLKIRKDMGK